MRRGSENKISEIYGKSGGESENEERTIGKEYDRRV